MSFERLLLVKLEIEVFVEKELTERNRQQRHSGLATTLEDAEWRT
jgi:hypothetical protein